MKRWGTYILSSLFICLLGCGWMAPAAYGQGGEIKEFRLQGNLMLIKLSKSLSRATLEEFVKQYKIEELGLYSLLYSGDADSLLASGWSFDPKAPTPYFLITKKLGKGTDIKKAADRAVFSSIPTPDNWRKVGGNRIVYGINQFRNGSAFRIDGDTVFFFLQGFGGAREVLLAGSFTNWQHSAFPMRRKMNGWEVPVLLEPGQYFYKFIVDGRWMTDPYNYLSENDGFGNINSVFFVPNKTVILTGHSHARKVNLIGSFNNYATDDLPMQQIDSLWTLSLYLQPGTHRYRFLVDGKIVDPYEEQKQKPASANIAIGKAAGFYLPGFVSARQVYLAGEFNEWRRDEIAMNKTGDGWMVSYVLGPGNYQYKFVVDGRWLLDPSNPQVVDDGRGNRNSFRVVEPNHTFRLKGFANARSVNLAGDFNNWSPKGLAMKRVNDEWVCAVYLGRGKHLYKFVVDGRWIRDPANPLWEDGDENSVLWKE